MNPRIQSPRNLAGAVLKGDYRIEGLIGQGGMSAVYSALKLPLNNRVAIKVLSRELTTNVESLKRFYREARITSSLGHPHIVQVFDFGIAPGGEPFLVMELLKGEDLFRRIHRVGRLSLGHTVHVIRQVASAITAAHARDVVHRDLKPANIFILEVPGEMDFVKVLDFGISKVLSEASRLTRDANLLGTPSYMSPEQAMGRVDDVDGLSDQWALACIAWKALCGRGPFVGDDHHAVLYQITHAEPPPIPNETLGFRPEIEQVLRRALSKDKVHRFPTVSEFALAFANAALPRVELGQGDRPAAYVSVPPTVRLPEGATAVRSTSRTPTASTGIAGEVIPPRRPSRSWSFWAMPVVIPLGAMLLAWGLSSRTSRSMHIDPTPRRVGPRAIPIIQPIEPMEILDRAPPPPPADDSIHRAEGRSKVKKEQAGVSPEPPATKRDKLRSHTSNSPAGQALRKASAMVRDITPFVEL